VLQKVKQRLRVKGKFDTTVKENARFKRICNQLKLQDATKVHLHVARSICSDFERFLTIFQQSTTAIHILHDELPELVRKMLLRFVKSELIEGKSVRHLLQVPLVPESYVPDDKFSVGSDARAILKNLKVDKAQYPVYKTLCLDIRKLFEACANHLLKKLPLSNVILKNIACLSPLLRKEPQSLEMMLALVANLPYCKAAEMKDKVSAEWHQYQQEEISRDMFVSGEGQNSDGTAFVKYKRIDEYWYRVMQITDTRGDAKYQSLGFIVKIALSLAHGQADVERGFSTNKQILDNRTVLGEKTLHGLRTVKEVIRKYDSIVSIPITRNLIMTYRNAHREYISALDKEKEIKAKESILGKRNVSLDDDSSKLKSRKIELEQKQLQAEKLVSEGTERLEAALKSGKVEDALPAQALLVSGNNMLKDLRKEIENVNEQLSGGNHQPSKSRT